MRVQRTLTRQSLLLICLGQWLLALSLLWATAGLSWANAPEVVIAVNHAPPYRIVEGNQLRGFYVDIIELIGSKLNWNIRYEVVPFKRALYLMESGNADLMLGPNHTDERMTYMDFSITAFPAERRTFWSRPEAGLALNAYEDLAGKTIGVLRGSVYFDTFDQDTRLRKHEAADYQTLFKMLESGHIDLVVTPELLGVALQKEMGLNFQRSSYTEPGKTSYLAVSKMSGLYPDAIPAIQQALTELHDSGAYQQASERYRKLSSKESCDITMGYRTNERLPLIAGSPNNSGLYLDLYSEAVKRIGCTLDVVRLPKNRILLELKSGTVDFYPGFNFTPKRAKYAYYMENGLPGGDIGVSLTSLPTITNLEALKGKTLLIAMGSPEWGAEKKGIRLLRASELTLDRAFQLLTAHRADFYIYNRSSIEYALRDHPDDQTLKLHPDCCGGVQPLYLGFSRASTAFQEAPNPAFDPKLPESPENFPVQPGEQSPAARFQQALQRMSAEGYMQQLYQRYYQRTPAPAENTNGG